MAVPPAPSGLRANRATRSPFASARACGILSRLRPLNPRVDKARDFPNLPARWNLRGLFRGGAASFYAEVLGDELRVLAQPFWLGLKTSGEILELKITRSGCLSRRRNSSRSD